MTVEPGVKRWLEDQPADVSFAQAGDQEAFARLMDKHKKMMWSVCLRITGNSYDAEDAVQDTLMQAWKALPKFRGEASLGTWLYRIAGNSSIAIVRRRKYTDTLPEELSGERDFAEQIAATDAVQRALSTMSEIFREILVLRELCDFSYEQIAAHQGVSVQTVKSRLNRARAAFRKELLES